MYKLRLRITTQAMGVTARMRVCLPGGEEMVQAEQRHVDHRGQAAKA